MDLITLACDLRSDDRASSQAKVIKYTLFVRNKVDLITLACDLRSDDHASSQAKVFN